MKKVRAIVLGERYATFSNPSFNNNNNSNNNLKTKLKIWDDYAGWPGTDLQDLQGDSSVFSSQTQV